MNVAVVDVGSNTIRLLVVAREGGSFAEVTRAKRAVGLGADIEQHGAVSSLAKLATAPCCSMSAPRPTARFARVTSARLPPSRATTSDRIVFDPTSTTATFISRHCRGAFVETGSVW